MKNALVSGLILFSFLFSSTSAVPTEEPSLRILWIEGWGIYGLKISPPLSLDLKMDGTGLLVAGVLAGSEAEKAGLKRGDVIPGWKSPEASGLLRVSRGGRLLELNILARKHIAKGAKLVRDPGVGARKVFVDQSGQGDYRTIAAAMAFASAGDTLIVRDGIYREELLLADGVTVQGEGKGGRIEAARPLTAVGAEKISLRGLTIRSPSTGILISSSTQIKISECEIYTEKGDGIDLVDSAEARVEACALNGGDAGRGIGLWNSRAHVSGSMISGYAIGILAKEKSLAEIRSSFLEGNATGLWAADDSRADVAQNQFTGKGKKGSSGLRLENSRATIEKNSIRRFDIAVNGKKFQGEVLANVITENTTSILVESGAAKVADNLILGNKDGIYFLSSAEGERSISRNTIRNNEGWAIFLSETSTGVDHNIIENNEGGIGIERGKAEIHNNTIVYQRRFGIDVSANAEARVYNNIVAFNSAGIRADASSALASGFNNVYANLISKRFPLEDGNYIRIDRLPTRSGEKIPIMVYPAYDLKAATDLSEDPKFAKPGTDYRPAPDSPLAKKRGKDGIYIGALPPAPAAK